MPLRIASRHTAPLQRANFIWLAGLAVLIAATMIGCNGNALTNVSGTVTYQGTPVASGEIRLTPDSNAGNQGPAVVAMIRDGKYKTPKDKGVVGGAYQLRIMGYGAAPKSDDPTASEFGDMLFETQHQTAEFPEGEEEYVHNITIE